MTFLKIKDLKKIIRKQLKFFRYYIIYDRRKNSLDIYLPFKNNSELNSLYVFFEKIIPLTVRFNINNIDICTWYDYIFRKVKII